MSNGITSRKVTLKSASVCSLSACQQTTEASVNKPTANIWACICEDSLCHFACCLVQKLEYLYSSL